MACLTRFNITNPPTPLGVPRYHPFYGARLLQHISTAQFKKIFACILIGLAVYLFYGK